MHVIYLKINAQSAGQGENIPYNGAHQREKVVFSQSLKGLHYELFK